MKNFISTLYGSSNSKMFYGLKNLPKYSKSNLELGKFAKTKVLNYSKEKPFNIIDKTTAFETPLILEQHMHGAFGVDFNKASVGDIVELSSKLKSIGIGSFFPTFVTDSVENIKRQIEIIKEAAKKCKGSILGIHLEGIFINPEKKGIHNTAHFMDLTPENYQRMEDPFIKLVTLAPELDKGLINYLKSKGVKVQAGHCVGFSDRVNGATHTFNAMTGIKHRGESTALSTLVNDNVYAEIIGDGVHVSDDALRLFFRSKPDDKVMLISDALPITHSGQTEGLFADSKIFYDGVKATSKDGTIAGSTMLLPEIIKLLTTKGLFKAKYLENPYYYHGLKPNGVIHWDKNGNILDIHS